MVNMRASPRRTIRATHPSSLLWSPRAAEARPLGLELTASSLSVDRPSTASAVVAATLGSASEPAPRTLTPDQTYHFQHSQHARPPSYRPWTSTAASRHSQSAGYYSVAAALPAAKLALYEAAHVPVPAEAPTRVPAPVAGKLMDPHTEAVRLRDELGDLTQLMEGYEQHKVTALEQLTPKPSLFSPPPPCAVRPTTASRRWTRPPSILVPAGRPGGAFPYRERLVRGGATPLGEMPSRLPSHLGASSASSACRFDAASYSARSAGGTAEASLEGACASPQDQTHSHHHAAALACAAVRCGVAPPFGPGRRPATAGAAAGGSVAGGSAGRPVTAGGATAIEGVGAAGGAEASADAEAVAFHSHAIRFAVMLSEKLDASGGWSKDDFSPLASRLSPLHPHVHPTRSALTLTPHPHPSLSPLTLTLTLHSHPSPLTITITITHHHHPHPRPHPSPSPSHMWLRR